MWIIRRWAYSAPALIRALSRCRSSGSIRWGKLEPKLAALVEPFAIGYHGVQQAMIQPDDRVLVVGAGTIGIFTMLAAKQKGAVAYITDVAEEKAADRAKNGRRWRSPERLAGAFAEQAAQITQGDGFDGALEAVGMPETLQSLSGPCRARRACCGDRYFQTAP